MPLLLIVGFHHQIYFKGTILKKGIVQSFKKLFSVVEAKFYGNSNHIVYVYAINPKYFHTFYIAQDMLCFIYAKHG